MVKKENTNTHMHKRYDPTSNIHSTAQPSNNSNMQITRIRSSYLSVALASSVNRLNKRARDRWRDGWMDVEGGP